MRVSRVDRRACLNWTMLLGLTVMWGSAFALTKSALMQATPDAVVIGRLLIGAALLLLIWFMFSRQLPRGRRLWVFFALIALFGNAAPFTLITWGQQTIDSGMAGILMAVMPLFTLVLARLAIPGERLTASRIIGFCIGLVGVAMLLGPGVTADAVGPVLPAMLAVLAGALCYSVSAVLTRLRPRSDVTSSATATALLGACMMLVVVRPAPADIAVTTATPDMLLAIAALGLFSTGLATLLYFRLLERTGPVFVSQLNFLIPVWAVAVGVVLFDEQLAASDYVAMLVILGGILVAQVGERAADDVARPVTRSDLIGNNARGGQ